MNAIDVLLWSAGSKRPLPEFRGLRDERLLDLLGIDPDEVLDLLDIHRLAQNFLWRSAAEKPAWATRYLRERASQIQMKAQQRLTVQFQMAQELSSWCSPDAPALILKGFTLYALTSDWSTLRFSNDMDVCPSDPEDFWVRMQSQGFSGKRHFTHEYAKGSKDGFTVDLHRNFPILSYPSGLEHEGMFSSSSTSTYHRSRHPNLCETSLTYEDLLPLSILARSPETSDIRVLNVTSAAILLCAHLFRGFVTHPHYLENRCSIRLNELREIALLSLSPEFNRVEFSRMVADHHVEDSVSLALSLLTSYEIHHALPPVHFNSLRNGTQQFPKNMVLGGWVTEGDAMSWLSPSVTAEFLEPLFYFEGRARLLRVGTSDGSFVSATIQQKQSVLSLRIDLSNKVDFELLVRCGEDYRMTLKSHEGGIDVSFKNDFEECVKDVKTEQKEKQFIISCNILAYLLPQPIRSGFVFVSLREENCVTYSCPSYDVTEVL